MYKKVLLAYDGSVEGRRALREGAKLAQLCRSEVFLLAVVEVSSIMTPEAGLTIPIELQTEDYKAILNEGTERLKALGFNPTARLEVGDAGQKIAEVAEEIGAHLVVVGHRPQGTLSTTCCVRVSWGERHVVTAPGCRLAWAQKASPAGPLTVTPVTTAEPVFRTVHVASRPAPALTREGSLPPLRLRPPVRDSAPICGTVGLVVGWTWGTRGGTRCAVGGAVGWNWHGG